MKNYIYGYTDVYDISSHIIVADAILTTVELLLNFIFNLFKSKQFVKLRPTHIKLLSLQVLLRFIRFTYYYGLSLRVVFLHRVLLR